MALTSHISVTLEIDWTRTGVWVNESSRLLRLDTQQGRSDSNDDYAAGTGSFALRNADGRFTPWYTAGPLWPNVLPGRPCRITLSYGGLTYPVFRGYASPGALQRGLPGEAVFQLIDEFEQFSTPPLSRTDLSTDIRTGEAVYLVLDDVVWPGPQLVTNSSFDVDLTGWTAGGANTLAQSTEVEPKQGDFCAKATHQDSEILAQATLTVTAAGEHSVIAWVYIPTAFDGSYVRAGVENFAGATGTLTADADLTRRNQWQPIIVRGFTVAGGDLVGLVTVRVPLATTNGLHIYIDDVRAYAGSRLPIVYPGQETLSYFTNHNRLVLNALRLISKSELGGGTYISKYGDLVFEDAGYRSREPVFATLTGTFDDLVPDVRFEDLISSVRATYPRFEAGAAGEIVYQLSVPRLLQPGDNTFDFDFNGYGVSLAISPVAVTDYTANTQQDGSGTDKTAQVTVGAFTYTGGGGSVTLTNLDSIASWLTAFAVRGTAVLEGNDVNAVEFDTPSPIVESKQLDAEFELQAIEASVQNWVEYKALTQGEIRQRHELTITADTDALMATVLGATLSKRLAITDTQAIWLLQIDDDYFIEALQFSLNAEQLNKVTGVFTIFDEDLGEGDWFRISGDVAEGLDYTDSVIAADAAIDGKRIGV